MKFSKLVVYIDFAQYGPLTDAYIVRTLGDNFSHIGSRHVISTDGPEFVTLSMDVSVPMGLDVRHIIESLERDPSMINIGVKGIFISELNDPGADPLNATFKFYHSRFVEPALAKAFKMNHMERWLFVVNRAIKDIEEGK